MFISAYKSFNFYSKSDCKFQISQCYPIKFRLIDRRKSTLYRIYKFRILPCRLYKTTWAALRQDAARYRPCCVSDLRYMTLIDSKCAFKSIHGVLQSYVAGLINPALPLYSVVLVAFGTVFQIPKNHFNFYFHHP